MDTPKTSLCYNHFAHHALPCMPSLHGSGVVALIAQRKDGVSWALGGVPTVWLACPVAISVGAFPTDETGVNAPQ